MNSPTRALGAPLRAALVAYTAYEYLTLLRALRHDLPSPGQSGPAPAASAAGGRVHVLVPGIDEGPYAVRTAGAFRALADHDARTFVWFVMTRRETQVPATGELLEPLVADHDRVAVIEDPAASGNKASQLNFAVRRLREQGLLDDDDTVAVFDFDSQPRADLVPHVRAKLVGHDVVQVVPVPFGALAGPPHTELARRAVWVDATLHLRRSLGIERARLTRSRTPVQYAMGAGLFVGAAVLRRVGGFPYVDDIPLGYRLSATGSTFTTVPQVNPVDVPDTFRAVLGSMVFVSRGILSWTSVLLDADVRQQAPPRRLAELTWLGLHDTWEITLHPVVGVGLSVAAIRRPRRARTITALAFWALPVAEVVVLRHVREELSPGSLWDEQLMDVVPLALGRRFWRALGPVRLAVRAIGATLRRTELTFRPTERASA